MESQPCNLILLVPMGQPMTEVWEIERISKLTTIKGEFQKPR